MDFSLVNVRSKESGTFGMMGLEKRGENNGLTVETKEKKVDMKKAEEVLKELLDAKNQSEKEVFLMANKNIKKHSEVIIAENSNYEVMNKGESKNKEIFMQLLAKETEMKIKGQFAKEVEVAKSKNNNYKQNSEEPVGEMIKSKNGASFVSEKKAIEGNEFENENIEMETKKKIMIEDIVKGIANKEEKLNLNEGKSLIKDIASLNKKEVKTESKSSDVGLDDKKIEMNGEIVKVVQAYDSGKGVEFLNNDLTSDKEKIKRMNLVLDMSEKVANQKSAVENSEQLSELNQIQTQNIKVRETQAGDVIQSDVRRINLEQNTNVSFWELKSKADEAKIKAYEYILDKMKNAKVENNSIEGEIKTNKTRVVGQETINTDGVSISSNSGVEKKDSLTMNISEFKQFVRREVDSSMEVKVISPKKMLIQINPEHLGRMDIQFEKKDDMMQIKIQIENKETKQEVETLMEELKEEFKEKGMDIEVEISEKRDKEEEKRKEQSLYRENKDNVGEEQIEKFEEDLREALGGD